MDYLELDINVDADFGEILMAELAEIGFDSFIETADGITAYVLSDLFDDRKTKMVIEQYAEKTAIHYNFRKIPKENWNQSWESNFSPIEVNQTIYVRATFHDSAPETYKHEIIITPKMSFGTGHHETTSQVMQLQLEIDHQGKKVLDVGTGTGILAILASKLGATQIHAFDIDDWSVENTLENIELNNTSNISVVKGTIADQEIKPYDIVLANINRNILLDEIPQYVNFMIAGSIIVMSGFYEHDISDIEGLALKTGLKKIKQISKNNWAAVVLEKL
jgi:ribosomal protein L11 methyltransferase